MRNIYSKQDLKLKPDRDAAGNPNARGEGNLFRLGEKGVIQLRFEHRGRAWVRSTGRTDLAGAKDRAWQIFQDLTGELVDRAPREKLRHGAATFGEVCDRYVAGIRGRKRIAEATMFNNVAMLAKIITTAKKFDGKLSEGAGSKWREVRVEAGGDLVQAWRRARYAAKGLNFDDDKEEDLWLNGSLNSSLAQARSVFSKAAWELYKGLELPPRAEILYAPRLDQPDYRFEALPADVDARMQRLSSAVLGSVDGPMGLVGESQDADYFLPTPAVAVIYELARFGGLTSKEMVHAQWSWLQESADGVRMKICARSAQAELGIASFKTKWNAKNRTISVNGGRVARWRAALGVEAGAAGYIIAGPNWTARADVVEREAVKWVRGFLPERTKALHELRKQAGSDVLAASGLNAAADFLGDSIETTKRFYCAPEVAPAL